MTLRYIEPKIGERETMPGLRDIEQQIKLQDNEDFVGLYDPTKDVHVEENEKYGTRYTFRLLARSGRLSNIQGGSRLFDEFVRLSSDKDGKPVDRSFWVKITAHGKPGDINRSYSLSEVEAPK